MCEKQGKVISFINMKGGVGKTTLTAEIADTITDLYKDKKILLIDIDPQSNLTQHLFEHFNLDEDAESDLEIKNSKSIQLILSDSPIDILPDKVIVSLKPNLDIICGELETINHKALTNVGVFNFIQNDN